jgi:hypothetical protein
MRSDFQPKNLKRAKETLSRQLETVQQTQAHQVQTEFKTQKETRPLLARMLRFFRRVF